MARSTRKQVTWKVDRKTHTELPIRTYTPDVEVVPHHREKIEGRLVPGALFMLLRPMAGERNPYVKAGPYPYIQESWATDAYQPMTLAIYAGTVRVEESKGGGIFRAPRHSFIINGVRYLTTNMNLFDPIG